jgi:hypothetical protein
MFRTETYFAPGPSAANWAPLRISAPLGLLSESATPSNEGAAEGYSSLDSRQRSIVIGETVPIVFGKRVTRFHL